MTPQHLITYRLPTLLLRENIPGLLQDFPGHPKRFSKTLYTAHALLNLLSAASSTANTLDQVHCTQRCNTHTHYIWNAKYFQIYCHFVSVTKSPNLFLCTLVNLNHNWIPGLSRTNLISQDFPSARNFRTMNEGLSRRHGNPDIITESYTRETTRKVCKYSHKTNRNHRPAAEDQRDQHVEVTWSSPHLLPPNLHSQQTE